MLFTSRDFIYFVIITFCIYYFPVKESFRKGYQVSVLLFASAIFYGWDDPNLLILLFVSCMGNTLCSLCILRNRELGNLVKIKQWIRNAIILNILLLAIFKYAGLFISLIPGVPKEFVDYVNEIPLPIGISFYTFHGISMIIDVSKGLVSTPSNDSLKTNTSAVNLVKSTRDVGFYMLFFPQLISGPIVRASQFWPQINAKSFFDIKWATAFKFLVIGYFLKTFVADNLAEWTPFLCDEKLIASSGSWCLSFYILAYTCQIFADFGGYSIIAIGLGILFGYRLPDNFNFPYLSTSITEFWRRWNITLSTWLRDYLYIPLGGNREGKMRTYLNLFIVMLLGGLWHGAAWKFAIWGGGGMGYF